MNQEEYQRSIYYSQTHIPYNQLHFDRGKEGEFDTYKCLESLNIKDKYYLINLYLPIANDMTSEIDIVLITKKGIFVIENKNFRGSIYGAEQKEYWAQYLRGKKFEFYNPFFQNATHIKYLKNFVNYKKIKYWSIVVFSDKCKKIKVYTQGKRRRIVTQRNLAKMIMEILANEKDVLTREQTAEICRTLYNYTQTSQFIKEKHIQNINLNK